MWVIYTRSRVYRTDLKVFARSEFLTELPDGSFVAAMPFTIETSKPNATFQWPVYHAMPPQPIYIDECAEFTKEQYDLLLERTRRLGSGGKDDG